MHDGTTDTGTSDLRLAVVRDTGLVTVAIGGELDAYTAPSLEDLGASLVDEHVPEVVLDLADTTFLDSSGLRAILTLHRRLEQEQSTLRLRAPSDAVLRLLEITGLREQFVVEPAPGE